MVAAGAPPAPVPSDAAMRNEDVGRLDLNLILVFDALMRHRNVSRAAASLGVGQSAASHSLRRLRTFFDDPLFARTAHGITPTAHALELSATVSEIASLVRNGLLTRAAFKPEAATRTLTLCMSDLGELTLLPTLIAALREASPGCTLNTVQAQPAEIRAMLESGAADLAIAALPPAEGEIFGQKLYTQDSVVIAHRSRALAGPLTLDAYCEAPHVAVTPIRGRPSVFDDALARMGRQRRIAVTTEHHLVIPYLIEADPSLIGTAPSILNMILGHHPDLVELDLPVELPKFEVCQYWHARSHKEPFHVWFRGLIAQIFQHHPGLDTGGGRS